MKVRFASQIQYWERSSLPEIPRKAVFIVIEAPLLKRKDGNIDLKGCSNARVFYFCGWNGSYHEAWWNSKIVVWAWGPHKMHRVRVLARQAKAWLAENAENRKDTATERMRTRMLVRAE